MQGGPHLALDRLRRREDQAKVLDILVEEAAQLRAEKALHRWEDSEVQGLDAPLPRLARGRGSRSVVHARERLRQARAALAAVQGCLIGTTGRVRGKPRPPRNDKDGALGGPTVELEAHSAVGQRDGEREVRDDRTHRLPQPHTRHAEVAEGLRALRDAGGHARDEQLAEHALTHAARDHLGVQVPVAEHEAREPHLARVVDRDVEEQLVPLEAHPVLGVQGVDTPGAKVRAAHEAVHQPPLDQLRALPWDPGVQPCADQQEHARTGAAALAYHGRRPEGLPAHAEQLLAGRRDVGGEPIDLLGRDDQGPPIDVGQDPEQAGPAGGVNRQRHEALGGRPPLPPSGSLAGQQRVQREVDGTPLPSRRSLVRSGTAQLGAWHPP